MTDTVATIIPPSTERNAVRETNKLAPDDRAVHDWYRFVLSFPPHLVDEYLNRFGATAHTRVLDPFCGTGTTVVECKKRGIPSVGIEINVSSHYSTVLHTSTPFRTEWHLITQSIRAQCNSIAATRRRA